MRKKMKRSGGPEGFSGLLYTGWVWRPAVNLAREQLLSLVDTWGTSPVRMVRWCLCSKAPAQARLQLGFTFKLISNETTLGHAWLGHFFDNVSHTTDGTPRDKAGIMPAFWPAYPLKRTFAQHGN